MDRVFLDANALPADYARNVRLPFGFLATEGAVKSLIGDNLMTLFRE
jgi:hypothetical protein